MRCATIGIFWLSQLKTRVLLMQGMTLVASVVTCVYLSTASTTQCIVFTFVYVLCYTPLMPNLYGMQLFLCVHCN